MIGIFLITLKDSYAYYGTNNELEIMKATIGNFAKTNLYSLCQNYADIGSCLTSNKSGLDKIPNLETETQLEERNKTIGDAKDDLRRFVGEYTTVTNNFICFGTDDEDTCKNSMDTYMYRIIGVDNQNRLKLIKATKIEKDSTKKFQWDSSYSDVKWNSSDLYIGLNGTDTKKYFIGNTKYGYMQQAQWTSLISPVTYYIGYSKNKANPKLFQDERSEHFDSGNISLMYLSDYLYASSANTNNWLFIANGLNGANNTPSSATAPSAEVEWTMTRYGNDSGYPTRGVDKNGAVGYYGINASSAVRPVFYLKNTINITNGDGSIDSPYVLKKPELSAADLIVANSSSLESEEAMQTRNTQIKSAEGNVEDDLRRFVGDKSTITDNFICFGTNNQETCKNNLDTYMYRIIGIDTQNRLKVIKATKIVDGSTEVFSWHSSFSADIKWQDSDLYKGLNGIESKNYFIGNTKYSYMNESTWTNLISPTTYYIGDSRNNANPQCFIEERKENFSNAKVGLMYVSDYLYGDNGTADTNNWLFIANGLNGTSNNGGNVIQPSAWYEWTMTKDGLPDSSNRRSAKTVINNGNRSSSLLNQQFAVRPVFYIDSSKIKLSGKGIIGDPYYITNVN